MALQNKIRDFLCFKRHSALHNYLVYCVEGGSDQYITIGRSLKHQRIIRGIIYESHLSKCLFGSLNWSLKFLTDIFLEFYLV